MKQGDYTPLTNYDIDYDLSLLDYSTYAKWTEVPEPSTLMYWASVYSVLQE